MGCGIAQLCASQGFSVKLHDLFPEALAAARGKIKLGLDSAVIKGRLTTQQADRAALSIDYASELSGLTGADLIIEAAVEDLETKRKIFGELDKRCPEAILATNTSSLSVAAIAQATATPHRVLGLHFFNPPVSMRLVETVRTPQTNPEVFTAVWDFVLMGLRKTPVDVKDIPGFIVNRVMRPYYLEAQRVADGGAGIAPVDTAAREIGQVPLGPFELMDLIGLDVNLSITRIIYQACGRPERFKPQALQEKLVELGHIGRKSGKGFYLYEGSQAAGENPQALAFLSAGPLKPAAAWEQIISSVIAEAQMAFKEGVAGKSDIDTAIKLAMNFPKGPFEWLNQKEKTRF
ncbi:MAG: hypothetical protein A3J74_03250 [Elusimicrobia bacterium RIFCSPHIGHO2_02_FULL_57_9]|nr:MAG: hypothetical protein A3J74_03250 [Elusimicrobia bacterium RIFCSPHIGHO2_02_FULL_57_9]